jgi:naphthoate synthase/2-ketocyclohexanecarboxyl-CoA hydrolase
VPYLTKVVGAKNAREMWMLCRKYKADAALEMGLVNTVVPLAQLEEEVDQWCAEMLALSPGCLEVLKASFDQEMDGYKESCITSAGMYPDWFDMPEGKEGGAAFVDKRRPEFWDIRQREAQMRKQLLDEYDALHSGDPAA